MTAPAVVDELRARLAAHGQEGVLRFWDELDAAGRERLHGDIERLDLDLIDELVERLVREEAPAEPPHDVGPLPLVRRDDDRERWRRAVAAGEEALRRGELAVVIVAGGQGTRLGFDGPKGTYPVGPVSEATLFQIHAEKVRALGRRYGRTPALYVMTSRANDEETRAFFTAHDDFGLEHVRLFVQGEMPAVDRESGRILLAERDAVALSPDGHGGTLRALTAPGPAGTPSCLEEMERFGVRDLFYMHVDNPLVAVGDPAFLGLHRETGAELSAKVVEKREPGEKVGLFVAVDGRPHVIEYSDLPDELAGRRAPDGGLELRAGRIGVELYGRAFVERIAGGGASLPYHRALKKVAYVDGDGRRVDPDEPNAVKFETFVFDAVPLARAACIVETERAAEFAPVKNASGPDSPDSARAAITEHFAGWLERAGARVRRDAEGRVPFGIEIGPAYALDEDELAAKLPAGFAVDGPLRLD